jgi:hypothetical protein
VLFRGQGLSRPLSDAEILSLFRRPNTLLLSHQHRQLLADRRGQARVDPRQVRPLESHEVAALRASLPSEFDRLVAEPDVLSNVLGAHSGASAMAPASGPRWHSPLISFAKSFVVERFATRRQSILFAVRRPKSGAIDRDELAFLAAPGAFVMASNFDEREVLLHGAVDPDSIESIIYIDRDRGERRVFRRDPADPSRILADAKISGDQVKILTVPGSR